MSNREKCNAILDGFTEAQLFQIATVLEAMQAAIYEAADDAFCERLYQESLNDPEGDEEFTLEDCKREWGLT